MGLCWHLGNTTVRSAYRLREALVALSQSPLNGNLAGRDNEAAFAQLLHERGVLTADRIATGGAKDFSDLGRKWRSALDQLGFITPKLKEPKQDATHVASPAQLKNLTEGIEGLTDRPYEITPSGRLLISAPNVIAMQESFLRSLLAYRIPSILESRYECEQFSPLRYVMTVLLALESEQHASSISFLEMATIVQTHSSQDGTANIVNMIIDQRTRRESARSTRRFDSEEHDQAARGCGLQPQTLDDYADCSFRYLRATGLFINAGRGIGLTPVRRSLAALIAEGSLIKLSDKDYLRQLWIGAGLPSDERMTSIHIIEDLMEQLKAREQDVIPHDLVRLSDAQLSQIRLEMEEQVRALSEQDYALRQIDCVEEIAVWMNALITRRPERLSDGTSLKVPTGEAAVYLEWAVWRAFLAINSLKNKPSEARRFTIDQDHLPVGTAPGRGPDMVFEFEDKVLVVEVTLTSSSRQEAAEGEPVRRHVAEYVEAYGSVKEVYGLFLAIDIDSNTAHTFRFGDWYMPNDTKINLQIVPMRLADFRRFFIAGLARIRDTKGQALFDALVRCRATANTDAPVWKKNITEVVDRSVRDMSGGDGD